MDCPNCTEECEREDYGDVYADNVKRPPSAEYRCPLCDWTAIWVSRQPLRILFDPKAENEVDMGLPTTEEG